MNYSDDWRGTVSQGERTGTESQRTEERKVETQPKTTIGETKPKVDVFNDEKKEEKSKCQGAHRFLAVASIIQILLLAFIVWQMAGGTDASITGGAVGLPEAVEAKPAVVNTEPASTPPAPKPTAVDMEALIDDDAVKGDANAPVTIVEFSDFECPFCSRYAKEIYPKIIAKYVETGKVKYVFRDFPLSFHQNARKAAEAAECAGEQGKYWEMHDRLFSEGVSGSVPSFKEYAKELGLNRGEFNECLDSGKMGPEVNKDFTDGQKSGVRGTPAFFINGELVSGAQPFENFEKIIEAKLTE